MIAVFLTEPAVGIHVAHAVQQIGREGLKVKTHGYCGTVGNAAEGTFQIPEWAFDGRVSYTFKPIVRWQICPRCAASLKQLREPPR